MNVAEQLVAQLIDAGVDELGNKLRRFMRPGKPPPH